MSSPRYPQLLEDYKAKNNGELPCNLYSKTNKQLQEIYIALTDDKWLFERQTFPKEVLVARIIKLAGIPHEIKKFVPGSETSVDSKVGEKRKADEDLKTGEKPMKTVKVVYNVLPKITPTQLGHMKRVLKVSDDEVHCYQHDRHLKPLWKSIGMTSVYPKMTGKDLVVERIKVFAENNLRYHGHLV
jgi:hypothetical protein